MYLWFLCGCFIVFGGRSEIVVGGFGEITHVGDVASNFLGLAEEPIKTEERKLSENRRYNLDFKLSSASCGAAQKDWDILQHKFELPKNFQQMLDFHED